MIKPTEFSKFFDGHNVVNDPASDYDEVTMSHKISKYQMKLKKLLVFNSILALVDIEAGKNVTKKCASQSLCLIFLND